MSPVQGKEWARGYGVTLAWGPVLPLPHLTECVTPAEVTNLSCLFPFSNS